MISLVNAQPPEALRDMLLVDLIRPVPRSIGRIVIRVNVLPQ